MEQNINHLDDQKEPIQVLLFRALREKPKKPTDMAGLNIEARFKIFDPETGEVKVEGRG